MSAGTRGMGFGLRTLTRIAGLEVIDRAGLREPLERALFRASRDGFRVAGAANRAFRSTRRLGGPARQRRAPSTGLFDLTPNDEQQMFQEACRQFAAERLRTVAQDADAASAAPEELLTGAAELGLPGLGVPEELGGPIGERSTMTAVIVAETLAHGDLSLALAALAPGGVATALGLWGDGDQQARYLPPFVEDEPPAAALAIAEDRVLFDPFRLGTTARRSAEGFVLDGVKSLVPLGETAELFVVAAQLEGHGPALFVVESGLAGVSTEPEPAMGLRAAATRRLVLTGVRLERGALLAEGDRAAYSECVQRARLAWCALAVGTARAVLDYVIPYVNERHVFGEPISHKQAVAFKVSDIAIEHEGMRLLTWRAASRADRGEDFDHQVTLARRLVAERGMQIGSDGVQLLGGHGYVKDHPVERWYRDLRAAGLMEGGLLV